MTVYSMGRETILNTAKEIVTNDRAKTHGSIERNFEHIAAVWSARLRMSITPHQVAIMLIDLKAARAWNNEEHADNWIDMAGYAACGGELSIKSQL
jgi:hypothetical protein